MHVKDAIEQRRSVKLFDSDSQISDATLFELFEDVVKAPSSFNIQHWKFIVVRDPANRQRLSGAAYNQPQLVACSAAVIVVGDPQQYQEAPSYWEQSAVPTTLVDRYRRMIPQFYEGRAQFARDEAIRSASFAAMTLMLRAEEMGIATGPMIGFDPAKVSAEFNIRAPQFPTMLIAMGKPRHDAYRIPRPYRRPVAEVVRLESSDGPGLQR